MGRGLVIVLSALSLLVAGSLAMTFIRIRPSRPLPTVAFVPFPADAWSRRSLGRLSLEAPFAFDPGPYVDLPQFMKDAHLRYEMSTSALTTHRDSTYILNSVYKPEVNVSLEGVSHGTMRAGISATSKQTVPRTAYEMTEVSVSGFPARRASYAGEARGEPFYIEALFIQDRQQVWTVHVAFSKIEDLPNAKRLLESVEIDK